MKIAKTPQPPYYAVIAPAEFSNDNHGYAEMAEQMLALAQRQPGFLGIENGFSPGFLLAVSYWDSLESIDAWRRQTDHLAAKQEARARWFAGYRTRIARVEREY